MHADVVAVCERLRRGRSVGQGVAEVLLLEHLAEVLGAPLREQEGPVVPAGSDERQLLGPGVGDVARDVPAILSHPPERHARRVVVAPAPEVRDECQRKQDLQQRAAEGGEDVAAPGEDQVTGLVDREVERVGPVEAVGREPAPDAIGGEEAGESAPPPAFRGTRPRPAPGDQARNQAAAMQALAITIPAVGTRNQ